VSLCRLIVTPRKGNSARLGGHADPGYDRQCTRCVPQRILLSGRGTQDLSVTAGLVGSGLGLSEGAGIDRVVIDPSVSGGKYLRTDSDNTTRNNLGDLPDC